MRHLLVVQEYVDKFGEVLWLDVGFSRVRVVVGIKSVDHVIVCDLKNLFRIGGERMRKVDEHSQHLIDREAFHVLLDLVCEELVNFWVLRSQAEEDGKLCELHQIGWLLNRLDDQL